MMEDDFEAFRKAARIRSYKQILAGVIGLSL